MANKYILKKTRRQAAVKVTGTGSVTIELADLAYADQSVTPANVVLTVSDIFYDVGNSANVKRNGNILYSMNAGQSTVSLSRDIGVVLDEQANANVIVNVGAAEGTVILLFSKGTGYNDPDRQNQGPGSL
jgi:hypothetical protein